MKTNENSIEVDGFRFISHLHTTARQLFICTEVIVKLENKQLPKAILSQLLHKWSFEQEINNQNYKKSKGKLTDNGKETTAIKYYLDLCDSLGLISHLNDFYSNKRLTSVFLYFIKKNSNRKEVTILEKIIYLFQLLFIDADGILLALSLLENISNKNQIELQREFKDALNERLISKQELAPQIIKTSINEKYRSINFIWKKPEKYAEHILIPRFEWLCSIGLVSIEKKGSSTIYCLTNLGILFTNCIPQLSNNKVTRDINERWLLNEIFIVFDYIFPDTRFYYENLDPERASEYLGNALKVATSAIKTSNSFRLPLLDTLIFVCIYLFTEKKVVINFTNIIGRLKNEFKFENKKYLLKESGRINEGYITTTTIE